MIPLCSFLPTRHTVSSMLSNLRTRNRTSPPLHLPRLLRLPILHQQLALLAIPIRQFLRNPHHIKRTRRLMENLVHFLERAVCRLWEEEVHTRHHGCIDDGEDYVGSVSNIGEGGRSNHYNHEVEDPVCGGGNCVCGRADGEGCDFGGIQPCHAEPADGEEGVEDEEENGLFVCD